MSVRVVAFGVVSAAVGAAWMTAAWLGAWSEVTTVIGCGVLGAGVSGAALASFRRTGPPLVCGAMFLFGFVMTFWWQTGSYSEATAWTLEGTEHDGRIVEVRSREMYGACESARASVVQESGTAVTIAVDLLTKHACGRDIPLDLHFTTLAVRLSSPLAGRRVTGPGLGPPRNAGIPPASEPYSPHLMPSFVGVPADQARVTFDGWDIASTFRGRRGAGGEVVAQQPAPGTPVGTGTRSRVARVTLTVG